MKIAVIGNYLPRRCGIATFTTDLCDALAGEMGAGADELAAVAMDDVVEGYAYPPRVRFQVRANVPADYLRAAQFLNGHRFDLAILQHEYGIFGGTQGAHVLQLVRNLRMPVITTLHTVLQTPSEEQLGIVRSLAEHSHSVVVMAHRAHSLLRDVYGIDEAKSVYIPHGIHDVPFERSDAFRRQIGLAGRKILLTFGLLSPGKGLAVMIEALAVVVERHPDAVYLILGETHPHVKRATGDGYRQGLHQAVRRLGLEGHVRFHNRFVDLDVLLRYIQTADLYVTPYLNLDQIVSGTLAYALGAGTAIVSTPYWYARELLAENRGVLVPPNDPRALAQEINRLLDQEDTLQGFRERGYAHGRSMVWGEVARSYLRLAGEARRRAADRPIPQLVEGAAVRIIAELPEVNLGHLRAMTDDTGILQHAKYSVPDRSHGYCVDDNARALVAAGMYHSLFQDGGVVPLLQTYLSFLHHSFNPENGRFRNFMSYDRRWLEQGGSEDSHGRSLWGLGAAVKRAPNDAIRNMAAGLFSDGLGVVEGFTSPRAWAFAIIGLHDYLEVYGGDADARRVRAALTQRLFALFENNASAGWPWCEDTVTYANAKLPQALLLGGQWIPSPEIFAAGIESLEWLLERQSAPAGHLSIIGNRAWHTRDGLSSTFDQQPIEAMCLVEACAQAFRATGEERWLRQARRCLNWFLGDNDLNAPVYRFDTGGCCDGLEATGVNENQGAESTLSWLIALLTLYEVVGQKV